MIPYGRRQLMQAEIDSLVGVSQSDFLNQRLIVPYFEQAIVDSCDVLHPVVVISATPALHIAHGDMADPSSLTRIIQQTQSDEIYNLAARSLVAVSFGEPEHAASSDASWRYLGNLHAKRDRGYARNYVDMQWLMPLQDKSDDFMIATGVQYSVRSFVDSAADELGIKICSDGKDDNEKCCTADGRCIGARDARCLQHTEIQTLLGDPSNAMKCHE